MPSQNCALETIKSNTDIDDWIESLGVPKGKGEELFSLEKAFSSGVKYLGLPENSVQDYSSQNSHSGEVEEIVETNSDKDEVDLLNLDSLVDGNISQNGEELAIHSNNNNSECPGMNIDEKYRILLENHEQLKKRFNALQDKKLGRRKTNTVDVIQFKCKECLLELKSMSGLKKHWRTVHRNLPFPKQEEKPCPFCPKKFVYLYLHIRDVHREKLENRCPVCKKEFLELKKHRKDCISCVFPTCSYKSTKVSLLLHHMEVCKERDKPIDLSPKKSCPEISVDAIRSADRETAIDLSPTKDSSVNEVGNIPWDSTVVEKSSVEISQTSEEHGSSPSCPSTSLSGYSTRSETPPDPPAVVALSHTLHTGEREKLGGMITNATMSKALHKRSRYPFDEDGNLEGYESELEDGDTVELTKERRRVKDDLESDLRTIDSKEATHYRGDDEFITLFKAHMTMNLKKKEQSNSKSDQKSTIAIYANAFRNHVLKSCHRNVGNFNSMDFLDCDREKTFTIDGRSRRSGDADWKCAPFMLSVDIVKDALEHCRNTKGESAVLAHIVSSVNECMRFIELVFLEKGSNLYGNKHLKSVRFAHTSVKEYLKNTNTWGLLNHECRSLAIEKKKINQYENPLKTLNTLKTIKEYQSSNNREENLNKVLSEKEDYLHNPGLLTEMSLITMGECINVTGKLVVFSFSLHSLFCLITVKLAE